MATNYGRDISCTDSLRTGRYASGPRLVAEAAYRRLTTPRGMLRGGTDEEHYGFDLLQKIGEVGSAAVLAASLPGQIRNELLKDERITSVDVVVTVVKTTPGIELFIAINAETDAGPFGLTLGVSEVSVDMLGLTVE